MIKEAHKEGGVGQAGREPGRKGKVGRFLNSQQFFFFLIKIQLKTGTHFVSLEILNSNGVKREPTGSRQ